MFTHASLRRGRWRSVWPWLAIVAVLAVTACQLHFQGRRWWCACGQPYLWSGDARSSHTSQHLFDPYSFTHVTHGIIFWFLLAWLFPRLRFAWGLWVAVCLSAAWEVFENTDFVIQRYRTATMALGYEGDSVANSLGDIVSCMGGFACAARLGWRWSLALALAIEAVLLVWIRDSLFLNILMLIHSFDRIKAWQLGS